MEHTETAAAWERLLHWLERHAPVSFRSLCPPPSPNDLSAVQHQLAVPLPDALLTILSMTDGTASHDPDHDVQLGSRFLPSGHYLLRAAEIPGRVRMLNSCLTSIPLEMVGHYWHHEWVPFAEHVAADALVIDQRPGPRQGQIGEFMHEDSTDFDLGSSLSDYLSRVSDALELQRDFSYYRPEIIGGRLEWDIIV